MTDGIYNLLVKLTTLKGNPNEFSRNYSIVDCFRQKITLGGRETATIKQQQIKQIILG
jgi:hypothetical protein